jgi:protein-S-isoprenylcysteine O-methyltransferase Ste14
MSEPWIALLTRAETGGAGALAGIAFGIGVVLAVALVGLLGATIHRPAIRFWPTPGPRTWQHRAFWLLFRGLNVTCVAVALLDWGPWLGLPTWLRGVAALVLVVAFGVFAAAFFRLGRDNSYGANDGLVTRGIYQWSRNPQNAMLIVAYAALAVVADAPFAAILCGAMIATYHLMVLAEEPWLACIYGEPYRAYCRAVPRYFNWKRLVRMRAA